MTAGYVVFRLAGQDFATPLAAVREVVRLAALATLPAMTPPLAGVMELRGDALPVMDLRPAPGGGDVLVLEPASEAGPVGFAVDGVMAVVGEDELAQVGEDRPAVLPSYVGAVLRHGSAQVFLVDVRRMLQVVSS